MKGFLRRSTAATVQLGPFVSPSDASQLYSTTPPAWASALGVSKAGAAQVARDSAGAIAHDAHGVYLVPLDATDVNTAGSLELFTDASSSYGPAWDSWEVLPEAVYDSLIADNEGLVKSSQLPAGFADLTAGEISTAVLTNTGDTLGADIVATAAQVAALSTAVAALTSAVAAIKAQTDQLAGEVVASAVADTQATATSFKGATGLPTVDNAFKNMIVLFTSGNLAGRTALVTAYAGASRQFTVRAVDLWTNPSDGDTFQVLGLGA